MAYAVYVDETDRVWLTDFGAQVLVRFDPETERFDTYRLRANANVRQLLGRPGEVWGAESGTDRLIVARFKANQTGLSPLGWGRAWGPRNGAWPRFTDLKRDSPALGGV